MARLTAEMRLSMAALRADAERASSIIQQQFAKNFGGGGRQGLATDPRMVINEMMAPVAAATKGINIKMAGLGMAAGMFSPWIGARLLNQSGLMGAGGGGGIMGTLLGPGGFGGFGAAYVALQMASRLLKGAFDELRRSVKEAAQLFFDAAKLRTTPGQLMTTKTILKALGVEGSQELLESLAYGRGRMSGKQMVSLIGISGQQGAAMYVQRIVDQDRRFWDEMAGSSRDFHVLWTAFSYNLKTLGSTLMNELLPAMNEWLVVINRFASIRTPDWAKGDNANLIKNAMGVAGSGPIGLARRLLSGSMTGRNIFGDQNKPGDIVTSLTWQRLHMSSFERMGFVLGNTNNPIEYQRQIAANTKTIADYVRNLIPQPKDRNTNFANPNMP